MVPLELLACPQCRAPLEASSEGALRCAACGARYPVVKGVPLLMTPADRARFQACLVEGEGATPASSMAARYRERGSAALAARVKRALRPPLPLVHNRGEPRLAAQPGSHNLYIGGGGRSTPGFLNLDLGRFPGVDLQANAERLPFRDSVLDAVECDAVLEHVEDPDALVREISRVLKPGGMVHAVVPFCHPYHAYPTDFRRWTLDGLKLFFERAGFECQAAGVRTGATATLLAFSLEYAKVVLGVGTLGKAAYALLGWVLFPLRYIDLWLNRRPAAHLLANHVYLLARKP